MLARSYSDAPDNGETIAYNNHLPPVRHFVCYRLRIEGLEFLAPSFRGKHLNSHGKSFYMDVDDSEVANTILILFLASRHSARCSHENYAT